MEQEFTIPITYKGESLDFQASFQPYGFTFRIAIDLNGTIVLFEPDEEGSFRALLTEGQTPKLIDHKLLEAIVRVLENTKGR